MIRSVSWCYAPLLLILMLLLPANVWAQSKNHLSGAVYEISNGVKEPLPGATVSIPVYGMGAITSVDGAYHIKEVPSGKVRLTVSFIGKVTIDTLLVVSGDQRLDFVMRDEDFRLKEVVVTAQSSKAGQSTSSKISTMAMEHLQAVSLSDLMSLLPGGISTNPSLSTASQVTIRSAGGDDNINALGTAIVQDGAPISNNANLQVMNPSVRGGTSALSGGASPAGGFDTRLLSLESVESVEVVRGVPSVSHGDLTSGAVLITSKAGRAPLVIKARTNPNLYHFSAHKGFSFDKNGGSLNVSGEYARNTSSPISSYNYFTRAVGKLLYSNTFFDGKWRTNTSLDLWYGRDKRDRNPDDAANELESDGRNLRLAMNSNGTINIDKGWLKNIKYVVSGSYYDKYSFLTQLYTSATAPYSMTDVDGAIIANQPGRVLYDVSGKPLTKYDGVDPTHYAHYLPSNYKGRYDLYGRELSFFSSATATFFGKLGATNHRILLGFNYSVDGNIGRGKEFSPEFPPFRNIAAHNATFRPRPYREIPFVHELGLFAEENFSWKIADRHLVNWQAGLRWDQISLVGGKLSPRTNLSIEIVPNWLYIRGAYGVTAKMPTLLYLYPERAYFEYININEMASDLEDKAFMTTTRVFDTQNKSLEIATNRKAEVGIDLKTPIGKLMVTAYDERMDNGYTLTPKHQPVIYNEYKRVAGADGPRFELSASNPVLATYYSPSNHLTSYRRGLEWDLALKRIDAIRTIISLSGAWAWSKNFNNGYEYYDGRSSEAGAHRTHTALYEKGMEKHIYEQVTSSIRATHNIPELGLVLTLTAEAIWRELDRYQMGNDTIPVAYISKVDGKIYPFDVSRAKEPEFSSLLRNRDDSMYIDELFPPLYNFNFNLTKEIGDFMRLSFFANNMFRSYPRVESKRRPGTFYSRNKAFFYGIELTIIIK